MNCENIVREDSSFLYKDGVLIKQLNSNFRVISYYNIKLKIDSSVRCFGRRRFLNICINSENCGNRCINGAILKVIITPTCCNGESLYQCFTINHLDVWCKDTTCICLPLNCLHYLVEAKIEIDNSVIDCESINI